METNKTHYIVTTVDATMSFDNFEAAMSNIIDMEAGKYSIKACDCDDANSHNNF